MSDSPAATVSGGPPLASGAILCHRSGPVVTVLLNKPDALNALDLAMWQDLAAVFEALSVDKDVACVVLGSAGGTVFAAGADITEFETIRSTPAEAKAYDLVWRRALSAVYDCPHPVVVSIGGACIGGGLVLAAMGDIRVAAESARFGVPINRLSVVLAYPELANLMRRAGSANLLEMLLEGRIMGAADALTKGLINRVVADNALAGEVEATVRRITAGAPLANRWHKAFVRRLESGNGPVSAAELDECYEFLETEDYREGLRAFTEKRRPRFRGL